VAILPLCCGAGSKALASCFSCADCHCVSSMRLIAALNYETSIYVYVITCQLLFIHRPIYFGPLNRRAGGLTKRLTNDVLTCRTSLRQQGQSSQKYRIALQSLAMGTAIYNPQEFLPTS
jgi:hypothetical protein